MKSFKDINKKETDLEEACWVGYKKVGMKKKGNRMVPNCVKEELVHAVFGKDYIDREPVMEGGVEDFYKGKLNKDQLNTIKNTWKNKKQTDVTQGVKDMIRGYDIFTRMDIKKANIKYLSALINDEVQHEEVDFISPLQDQIEIIEMNSVVRKVDIEEAYFSADQLERLAKAYNVMKDKTISLANAKKLGKMVDGIPAGALNDLRKKKIPFISGLALSRMIKLKVPVTEGLDKEDEKSVDDVVKQLKKAVKAHQGQVKTLTKDLKDEKDLEEDVASDAKLVEKKRKLISANSDFVDLLLKKQDLVHDKKQLGGTNSTTFKLSSDIKKVEQEIKTSQVKLMRLTEDIEDLEEADLSKSQVTKVHKQADDLPKKDFMKRYGKDGDAVRYATATNMVKKKLGIGEDNKLITKGELKMNESYKLRLNSAMDHYKIESLGDLKDEDQKAFFDYVDGLTEEVLVEKRGVSLRFGGSAGNYISNDDRFQVGQELKKVGIKFDKIEDGGSYASDVMSIKNTNGSESKILAAVKKVRQFRNAKVDAKSFNEGLTAGQKKLPAGLQKAILSKQGDKKEVKEEDAYDGTPAEVAKLKAKEKADAEKAKSKKEEVNETHTGQTATANRHQKSAGGEKSPISHMVNKSIEEITTNGSKTFAQMRAEVDEACWDSHKQVGTKQKGGKTVPNCVPKNEAVEKTDAERTFPGKDEKIKGENPADKGKKEQETGEDTRDPKKKTMSGKVATSPEMNPKVDYKY